MMISAWGRSSGGDQDPSRPSPQVLNDALARLMPVSVPDLSLTCIEIDI